MDPPRPNSSNVTDLPPSTTKPTSPRQQHISFEMASLNLSINGPSIKSSYNGVINGPAPSTDSPTHAQWALFTVQAPLQNAFQDSGAKESILKVQGTGGEGIRN